MPSPASPRLGAGGGTSFAVLLCCCLPAFAGDLETRGFMAYELAHQEEGGHHWGGGIGARYYWSNWGIGAETIQWSLADEAIDQWSLEAAYRFSPIGPKASTAMMVAVCGSGRNEEDENLFAYAGAELHWRFLNCGARLVREEKEGWKGLFTGGLSWTF